MESLAMSEASIKRSHIGASGREDATAEVVVHAAIINSVDTAQLNKVCIAGNAASDRKGFEGLQSVGKRQSLQVHPLFVCRQQGRTKGTAAI